MKITEAKETIQAESYEVTHKVYACDAPGCSFQVIDDEAAAKKHHAKTHACKEKRNAGGHNLLRFETEEDAKVFAAANARQMTRVSWDGSGWYVQDEVTQPCPRGCCTDDYYRLFPLWKIKSDLRDQIRDLAQQLRALQNVDREKTND